MVDDVLGGVGGDVLLDIDLGDVVDGVVGGLDEPGGGHGVHGLDGLDALTNDGGHGVGNGVDGGGGDGGNSGNGSSGNGGSVGKADGVVGSTDKSAVKGKAAVDGEAVVGSGADEAAVEEQGGISLRDGGSKGAANQGTGNSLDR